MAISDSCGSQGVLGNHNSSGTMGQSFARANQRFENQQAQNDSDRQMEAVHTHFTSGAGGGLVTQAL